MQARSHLPSVRCVENFPLLVLATQQCLFPFRNFRAGSPCDELVAAVGVGLRTCCAIVLESSVPHRPRRRYPCAARALRLLHRLASQLWRLHHVLGVMRRWCPSSSAVWRIGCAAEREFVASLFF